jgi:hypothetical protein
MSVSDNTTKERRPLILNLLSNIYTTKKKAVIKPYVTLCTISKEILRQITAPNKDINFWLCY